MGIPSASCSMVEYSCKLLVSLQVTQLPQSMTHSQHRFLDGEVVIANRLSVNVFAAVIDIEFNSTRDNYYSIKTTRID